MHLFEVTFRISILPDGFDYTGQCVVLAEDSEAAKEQARQSFRRNQPYHKTDTDFRQASLDKFSVAELESFLCYGVCDKPCVWHRKFARPGY